MAQPVKGDDIEPDPRRRGGPRELEPFIDMRSNDPRARGIKDFRPVPIGKAVESDPLADIPEPSDEELALLELGISVGADVIPEVEPEESRLAGEAQPPVTGEAHQGRKPISGSALSSAFDASRGWIEPPVEVSTPS